MGRKGGPRRSSGGATLCFAVIAFIALVEVLSRLVFPFIGGGGLLAQVTSWLAFVASVAAYVFIGWYAFGFVSHRSTGWKVLYWVIIFILLFARFFGFFYFEI